MGLEDSQHKVGTQQSDPHMPKGSHRGPIAARRALMEQHTWHLQSNMLHTHTRPRSNLVLLTFPHTHVLCRHWGLSLPQSPLI